MDVSPETIRTVEFRERLRGYNQDDVDQFLERMAAGVEILQQRLRDASQRAARAEERPEEASADDSLRRTLALAQRTADLAVEEAREHAARLVQSAQGEAHSVVAAAQSEAEAVIAEAEQRAASLVEEAQGAIEGEVQRLEARREHLGGEIVALERHLAQARARAYTSLTDAARQIEHLVPEPAPAPVSVAPEPTAPEPTAPEPTASEPTAEPELDPTAVVAEVDIADGATASIPAAEQAPLHDALPPGALSLGIQGGATGTDPESPAGTPAPSGPAPFQGASLQS